MKVRTRNIIAFFTSIVVIAAITVICIFASDRRDGLLCTDIIVEIADSAKIRSVSREDVMLVYRQNFRDVAGMSVESIDLRKMEMCFNRIKAVRKSDVWVTGDGILHIRICQREPLFMIRRDGFVQYADKSGCIFPLKQKYPGKLIIFTGNVPVGNEKWLKSAADMVSFIKGSRMWRNNIGSIHVGVNGELAIKPIQGRETFIFGRLNDIRPKFKRIEKYYSAIVPHKGENYYATVNVKYDNQIICKKQ